MQATLVSTFLSSVSVVMFNKLDTQGGRWARDQWTQRVAAKVK
jgi:hypothetical protein